MSKVTYEEVIKWKDVAPEGHLAKLIDSLDVSIKARLVKSSLTVDDLLYTAHRDKAIAIMIQKDLATAERWDRFVQAFGVAVPQRRADAHKYITCVSLDKDMKSGFFNLSPGYQNQAQYILTGACNIEALLSDQATEEIV